MKLNGELFMLTDVGFVIGSNTAVHYLVVQFRYSTASHGLCF